MSFPQIVGVYIKRKFDSVHGDYIFLIPKFRTEDDREIDGEPIAIGYDSKETLTLAGRVSSLILDGSYIYSPFIQNVAGREVVSFLRKRPMSQIYSCLSERGF